MTVIAKGGDLFIYFNFLGVSDLWVIELHTIFNYLFILTFQAVFKQFAGGIYGGSDNVVADETELQQHQKLERLYISTRAGKVAYCSFILILLYHNFTF